MHGDAFRDPAGERVQINVLLTTTTRDHSLVSVSRLAPPTSRSLRELTPSRVSCGSTHRVGSGEVVAAHHLHVGLLDEGDPQLVPVAGVGAQQLPVVVHGQVVVDDHLQESRGDQQMET